MVATVAIPTSWGFKTRLPTYGLSDEMTDFIDILTSLGIEDIRVDMDREDIEATAYGSMTKTYLAGAVTYIVRGKTNRGSLSGEGGTIERAFANLMVALMEQST